MLLCFFPPPQQGKSGIIFFTSETKRHGVWISKKYIPTSWCSFFVVYIKKFNPQGEYTSVIEKLKYLVLLDDEDFQNLLNFLRCLGNC